MRKQSSMDEYDSGLCLQNRREKRLQRNVQLLIVAVLVQFLISVILLVALGLRGQEPQLNQIMKQTNNQSSVNIPRQQQPTDLAHPSAMLTAPRENNTSGKYLLWEEAAGIAHCHGGFSYSSGNLIVPRKGLYRIFLQITYSSSEIHEDDIHLLHTVYSVSDAYPLDRGLLSAEERVSSSTSYWCRSLYTAGSYILEANTTLHVSSTHPELISKTERLVFFGAYLLSEHVSTSIE